MKDKNPQTLYLGYLKTEASLQKAKQSLLIHLNMHSAELVVAFIFWITVVNSFLGSSKNFAPNSQALQYSARYSWSFHMTALLLGVFLLFYLFLIPCAKKIEDLLVHSFLLTHLTTTE